VLLYSVFILFILPIVLRFYAPGLCMYYLCAVCIRYVLVVMLCCARAQAKKGKVESGSLFSFVLIFGWGLGREKGDISAIA